MRRLLLILCLMLTVVPPAAAKAGEAVLEARAYLLMDAATGQVLIEHEGRTPLPIASTTKIMTAILALERGNLADSVTVGQKAYETGGSTIWLEVGERHTLEDLLYALMLASANDAAVAIAEHLAGSEERFAAWMNEKARALGATRTHFVNSHGLHDPDHYATAYDLALIARYALQNPTFRQIIATAEREIPGPPGHPPRRLVNGNRLLGYYEGANGVKNGFTEEAGLTNVASARRGETELIAVILGAEGKLWTSSMALLDFGFARYGARIEEEQAVTPEGGRPGESQANQVEPLPDPVPVAAERLEPPQMPPGEAILWFVLWLGGALALTLHLNQWRTLTGYGGAKEESNRGAA